MRALKVMFNIIRFVIRVALLPVRLLLILLEMAIGYAGAVIAVVGSMIGAVFILSALIGLPAGIVVGYDFWGMMLCGVCFGVLPMALTIAGTRGISLVRNLLSLI